MKDNEGRIIGKGMGFERIRRITGYLVGTLARFNNAKRAEEHDRVKHNDRLLQAGCETFSLTQRDHMEAGIGQKEKEKIKAA